MIADYGRAFPFRWCLKLARISGSNQSICVLFSGFNYSKLLLLYVKRAYESMNICKFDKLYKLIEKSRSRSPTAAAHFRSGGAQTLARISGSSKSILVLISVFNCLKLLLSCVKRAYKSMNMCYFDKLYKLIEKRPSWSPTSHSRSGSALKRIVTRAQLDQF